MQMETVGRPATVYGRTARFDLFECVCGSYAEILPCSPRGERRKVYQQSSTQHFGPGSVVDPVSPSIRCAACHCSCLTYRSNHTPRLPSPPFLSFM